jgi:hypothetical protein
MADYTCGISVYLRKNRQNATQMMTMTHVTVKSLTRKVGRVGHELYQGNTFSSLDSCDDLHTRAINCCGTVRQNRK